MRTQVVEPSVSRVKFDGELSKFNKAIKIHRDRGILLLKAEYPDIELLFLTHKTKPAVAVFAVRLNFANYDLEPISIQFINQFTGDPARFVDIPTHFHKKIGVDETGAPIRQPLLQVESPTSPPFLCFRGVREYHNHPAHTGDSWLLYHQKNGIGSLGYLVEKLYEHGIAPINSFQVPVFMANVNGLQLGVDLSIVPE